MTVDFTKMPIGTKVETAWGPGKIVLSSIGNCYAVSVLLDNGKSETYTAEGKYLLNHARPTLFLAPFEWPTQEQPLPDLPVDAPIMVRNYEYESWGHRHFAAWKYGKVTTFMGGRTSFTENVTIDWEQWRLPTEEELKGIS
jgi:hypothetical protein